MRFKLTRVISFLVLLMLASSVMIFSASYKYYFTGKEHNNLRKASLKFNISSDKKVITGELKVIPYCSPSAVAVGGNLSFKLKRVSEGRYVGSYEGYKLVCKDVRLGWVAKGAKTSGRMEIRKKKIRGVYYIVVELSSQGTNEYLFPGKGKIPF